MMMIKRTPSHIRTRDRSESNCSRTSTPLRERTERILTRWRSLLSMNTKWTTATPRTYWEICLKMKQTLPIFSQNKVLPSQKGLESEVPTTNSRTFSNPRHPQPLNMLLWERNPCRNRATGCRQPRLPTPWRKRCGWPSRRQRLFWTDTWLQKRKQFPSTKTWLTGSSDVLL